jgi:DNA-binding transcriptional regulator YiaG
VVAKVLDLPKVVEEEPTKGMTPEEIKSIRKSLMSSISVFKGYKSYHKVDELF